MKKTILIGATLLSALTLTACGAQSNGKSNQSSSTSAQNKKEVWPTQASYSKAWKIAKSLDQASFGERAMKQDYIRYTDILNDSTKTKFIGTAQTINGNVIEVTKPHKGFQELTIDASSPKVDKTYDIIAHTNKKIREDDYLSVGVVVAGPAKYFNNEGKAIHCVAGVTVSNEVYNAGDINN